MSCRCLSGVVSEEYRDSGICFLIHSRDCIYAQQEFDFIIHAFFLLQDSNPCPNDCSCIFPVLEGLKS